MTCQCHVVAGWTDPAGSVAHSDKRRRNGAGVFIKWPLTCCRVAGLRQPLGSGHVAVATPLASLSGRVRGQAVRGRADRGPWHPA